MARARRLTRWATDGRTGGPERPAAVTGQLHTAQQPELPTLGCCTGRCTQLAANDHKRWRKM